MKNTIQSWAAKYIQLYTYYTRKYISKTIVTCLYKYTHDISNYYNLYIFNLILAVSILHVIHCLAEMADWTCSIVAVVLLEGLDSFHVPVL